MKTFKNFKILCKNTKYPNSYKIKTLYSNNGVLRCYSNNTNDIILDNKTIFYKINNFKIKKAFEANILIKKQVHFYLKRNKYIYDCGLFYVIDFNKNYVKLIK